MDSKIVYVNQKALLSDPGTKSVLSEFDYPWDLLSLHSQKFDLGTQSLYVRGGHNNLPFCNDIVDIMGWQIPEFQSGFKLSFGSVTDMRCLELRKTKFDLPWIVFWSGGIDSTTIITSIIKNIPRSDWKNITVACNHGSIAEYPWFFKKFIEPNFDIVDSSVWISQTDTNYYFINGEPADQLFAGSISQSMMLDDPRSMTRDLITDPDFLIQYLENTSQGFGRWYYETIMENIVSTDVPVKTYHDFFWWTFFNHSWVAIKMRTLLWSAWGDHENAKCYFDRFINWFDTPEYQCWAMANNTDAAKYGTTIGNYKQAAKDYIYLVTKDPYYWRFKTKTSSGSNLTIYTTERKHWVCMLSDFSLLNFEDHRNQIMDLLPSHLRYSDG